LVLSELEGHFREAQTGKRRDETVELFPPNVIKSALSGGEEE
jgi:hypothetical protein